MVEAGLDFLNAADVAGLSSAAQGEALAALGRAGAKHTAAHARVLAAFTAGSGYEGDGQFGPVPWLTHRTRITKAAARRDTAWVRRLAAHPAVGAALADGAVPQSWARDIGDWTGRLPAGLLPGADEILLTAAAGGAALEDLRFLATQIWETYRSGQPDPGGDPSFEDRDLRLETTIGGAGRLAGDLTPECAAAVQAVLDALGKHRGPGELRSQGQRWHDALAGAAQMLIAAGMCPGRAGQPTRCSCTCRSPSSAPCPARPGPRPPGSRPGPGTPATWTARPPKPPRVTRPWRRWSPGTSAGTPRRP
jgi:hypothetical protein